MDLIFFITILFCANQLAPVFTIGNHTWFINLSHWAASKFPLFPKTVDAIFDFRLFFCDDCVFFWLILGAFAAVYTIEFSILAALICYIVRKDTK